MKRIAIAVAFCAIAVHSLSQTTTGKLTGSLSSLPKSIPQTGLTNAWFFDGAPTTVRDWVGSQPMTARSGVLQGISSPTTNSVNSSFLLPAATALYSTPYTQYNVSAATGTIYQPSATASQTWGDGQPHTLVTWLDINPYTYGSTGVQNNSWSPVSKNNEYGIRYLPTSGGAIQFCSGTSLGTCFSAAAYPVSANRFLTATGSTVNSNYGQYLVRITYDGVSNACIGINDGPLTCNTITAITTSAAQLFITAPATVGYLLSYNSVLKSSTDSGTTCGTAFSGTPCIIDQLYDTGLQNRYNWNQVQNPANKKSLAVNTSTCVEPGWGSSYNTYQSSTITTPTYTVNNPYSLCSVTTNSPSLTFDIAALNGQTQVANTWAVIAVWIDGTFSRYVYVQATGGSAAGVNPQTIAVATDGATHTVKFTAEGLVAYSGSDTTPYTGLGAVGVTTVSVYGNYSLNAVAPTASNVALIDGDSISVGFSTNYPPTDGAYTRLRQASGGNVGNVYLESMGGGAIYHNMGCNPGAGGGSSTTCTSTAWAGGSVSATNSRTPAAYANLLKTRYGCPKYYFMQKSTNDQARSLWFASDAQIAMGYFWTQWNSVCPSTINYQLSETYKNTSATANTKGDYAVHYSLTGTALSPNWQTDLAAACSAATSCTNIDISGTSATGVGANTQGFPVWNSNGISLTAAGTSGYTTATAQPTTSSGAGTGATASWVASGGIITSATLTAAGTGYAVGDTLTPTQAGSSGDARFTVLSVTSTGAIWMLSSCNAYPGGPLVSNNAMNTDGLHPTTCGQAMIYYGIFHYKLGWI